MKASVPLTLQSIQHVGIPVTDLTRSEAFYQRLGFVKVMQAGFTHNDEPGTCVMMQQHRITIELYQLPQRELDNIRSRRDGHIDHIAFDVPDIDDAFQKIQSAGFTILEEAPVKLNFWKKGCRYFNIAGPDGERLEFNQIL